MPASTRHVCWLIAFAAVKRVLRKHRRPPRPSFPAKAENPINLGVAARTAVPASAGSPPTPLGGFENDAWGFCGALATAGVCLAALLSDTAASQSGGPRLNTNESYVEDVNRSGDFDISDPVAVFGYVFRNLPERVTVYPTENYYYFNLHHRGVRYSGNIRLESETRDQGKIHFAYGIDHAEWKADDALFHILLDPSHGLAVEKQDRLTYRLSYAGKSVVFALNDLSGVKPPAGALQAGERYIGPVFDESAIRFFLVYDPILKLFRYILDETVPVADALAESDAGHRILIGKRTGFAFYRDHRAERKILIGVFAKNADLNTYFDGPFDQLPDNFIDGDTLRDAILDVEPGLRGKIDRYGSSPDGQLRYAISPYRHYEDETELAVVHRCATNRRTRSDRYYACFSGRALAATKAVPGRPNVKRTAPSRP